MRLRIVHETAYRYERPIRSLVQALRLSPRPHDGQHIRSWRIEPSADGRLRPHEDALGNLVHTFSADAPVEALTMRVSGEIETSDTQGVVRGAVERAPDLFYLRETDLTRADADIRDLAGTVAKETGSDLVATLHGLLDAVKREIAFEPGPTTATTTAQEAFALRRGVCQDLTHVFLAAARHLNVPARYVSGYFFRSDGVLDQDAGHAWAEAKIPHLGWVGFDPTNGVCTGEAHARVAIGLDYLGAAPIRGSRFGGGDETLEVRLRVDAAPVRAQGQAQIQS